MVHVSKGNGKDSTKPQDLKRTSKGEKHLTALIVFSLRFLTANVVMIRDVFLSILNSRTFNCFRLQSRFTSLLKLLMNIRLFHGYHSSNYHLEWDDKAAYQEVIVLVILALVL